jgi:hypothetical protein
MYLRAVNNPSTIPMKDSTLLLENLAGNIDIIIPRRATNIVSGSNTVIEATPSNSGIFSISKRVNSGSNTNTLGTVLPILQISTSTTTTDAMTLRADFQVLDPVSGTTTTLISPSGIDTNSVITDALYLVNPVGGGLLPVAAVTSGAVTFPSLGFASGSTVSSPQSGSLLLNTATAGNQVLAANGVVLGGNSNMASGTGATIIGGNNGWGQSNQATGLGSTIIGSENSLAAGAYSTIIGGKSSRMLSASANYNHILGGYDHEFGVGTGSYNVILGGASHKFLDDDGEAASGGHTSALVGGQANIIRNAGWRVAMLGGYLNEIRYAHDAVIVGGYQNRVGGDSWTWSNSLSAILGGSGNSIGSTPRSVILGGSGNQITSGYNSAILGAEGAVAAGGNLTVAGYQTRGLGDNQVVIGRYNVENNANASGGKVFIIGNGTATTRSNAMSVDWTGKVQAGSMELTNPSTSDISMGPFTAQP